ELVAQTRQPLAPTLSAADHRGVDEQPLPSPRRARRSIDDRNWIRDEIGGGGITCTFACGDVALDFKIRLKWRGREFRVGADRRLVDTGAIGIGHLSERKIFRKTARREVFRG